MKEYQDLLDKYLNRDTLDTLHKNFICDTLPFLESIFTKLRYALIEFNSIDFVVKSMKQDRENWFQELHKSKTVGLPETKDISYFGHSLDTDTAIEKLVFSFFQYLHSAYDISAQLINTALLANEKKKIDDITFKTISNTLKNYSDYTDVMTLIDTTKKNEPFKYIDAFNNINKHQYNMDLHVMLDISKGEVETKIGGFEKRGTPHSEVNMKEHMENCLKGTISFLDNLLGWILNYLNNNEHKYNQNRFHSINAWVQTCKNNSSQNGGYLYIITPVDLNIGDTFRILYVHKDREGRFNYKNIHSEDIFLKDSEDQFYGKAEYIKGTYETVNPIFELLEYKEYLVKKVGDISADKAVSIWKPKLIFGDLLHMVEFEN